MRIVTLVGNDITQDINYENLPGQFIFLFMENGIFYLNTKIGKLWKLEEHLGIEHRAMVTKVLSEMNESKKETV